MLGQRKYPKTSVIKHLKINQNNTIDQANFCILWKSSSCWVFKNPIEEGVRVEKFQELILRHLVCIPFGTLGIFE